MTAFAVVVQKRGTRHAVEEVAEALGSIGGAYPTVVSLGACALLLAALHHDDPDGPVVFPAGIGVAGQIVLEGRRDLASMLRQPTSACGAALAGAAYLRWGESCTDHLSGEYAFALWDPNARTIRMTPRSSASWRMAARSTRCAHPIATSEYCPRATRWQSIRGAAQRECIATGAFRFQILRPGAAKPLSSKSTAPC